MDKYLSDPYIEALWDLHIQLKNQPDEYVVTSYIKKPYHEYLIKIYRAYMKNLKLHFK
jgi:hypothetical protein